MQRTYQVPTTEDYWNNGDFDDSELPDNIYYRAAEIEAAAIEEKFPDVECELTDNPNNAGDALDDVWRFVNDNSFWSVFLQQAIDEIS